MFVTLLGIVMLVRFVQPENAPSPMVVTLLGIIEFLQPKSNVFVAVKIIALQLSRESKYVFSWTARECTSSNACHAIGDSDAGET